MSTNGWASLRIQSGHKAKHLANDLEQRLQLGVADEAQRMGAGA